MKGYQYQWLEGGYDLEIGFFIRDYLVDSFVLSLNPPLAHFSLQCHYALLHYRATWYSTAQTREIL